MSFEGYHVSRYEYEPGQVIGVEPGRVTHFHETLKQEDNVAAEARLKPHKPDGAPCRTNCIYVFGDLADCSLYGSSEHKDAKIHYYKVSFENGTKVPMVLVDHIRKQVDPTEEQIRKMASEYWSPSLDWEYWEYLTDAIKIIEQVEPLDMGSMAAISSQNSFGLDGQTAAKFRASVMKGE